MEINVNDTAASRRGAVRMLNQSINLSCLPIIMRIRDHSRYEFLCESVETCFIVLTIQK